MPRYDFLCEKCPHEFSESQAMGTTNLPACPTCKNTESVRKIIRAPMIHFKGSGFYKTDGMKKASTSEPPKKTEEKKADTTAAAPTPAPTPAT